MKNIVVNSEVMWRGSWGESSAKLTTIENIEQTANEHEKYGESVDSVGWVKGSWEFPFVASLGNGHWAYSTQLKPA